MNIEQAQEVALDIRDVYADPLSLPIRAADTIDALITALSDERLRCTQADNAVAQMAAELATLKGQEPVFYINQDSLSAFKDGAKGWGTVWTVNHGDYKVPLYPAAGAQPYDQQALELCEACGWKAIIPGEPCLVCERNDALTAGAQPVSHDSIEFPLKLVTAERDALRADAAHMTEAIMHAYGHLWHVNTEPMAPIPLRSPEAAAYEARKILRDMLTNEQRGIAINAIDLAMKGKS